MGVLLPLWAAHWRDQVHLVSPGSSLRLWCKLERDLEKEKEGEMSKRRSIQFERILIHQGGCNYYVLQICTKTFERNKLNIYHKLTVFDV